MLYMQILQAVELDEAVNTAESLKAAVLLLTQHTRPRAEPEPEPERGSCKLVCGGGHAMLPQEASWLGWTRSPVLHPVLSEWHPSLAKKLRVEVGAASAPGLAALLAHLAQTTKAWKQHAAGATIPAATRSGLVLLLLTLVHARLKARAATPADPPWIALFPILYHYHGMCHFYVLYGSILYQVFEDCARYNVD